MPKQSLMRQIAIALTLLLVGCGISQSEYDKIKAENQSLKTELDELQNGEKRLVATIDKAYLDKNYARARASIVTLKSRHPESNRNADYAALLVEIDKAEAVERTAREIADRERTRLANLSNTGMWQNSLYVDNFGEPTRDAYIRNARPILGTFSNTATQDAPLRVRFLINDSSHISIMLYEYAGDVPITVNDLTGYTVRVRDQDGKNYEMYATSVSDRLGLEQEDARKLHAIFINGGRVRFWIQPTHTLSTQYRFDIDNADWYSNAYEKLSIGRRGGASR
jgi:outer membrane murein-binding lipoprotein Lpp